jgi:hypothetical protein
LVVSLEFQAKPFVEDLEVAIPTAHDRFRHDCLNFLCHDTDVRLGSAIVGEAIEAEAVVEMAEKSDVVLERNIGPSATTPTTAAAEARSAPTCRTDVSSAGAYAAELSSAPTGCHARRSSSSVETLTTTVGMRARSPS